MIAVGLIGGGLAGLAVGYGDAAPATIAGALVMGLFATLALIRLWAAVADAHGPQRAVAMTEGEVAVSLAGIAIPLLIAGLAPTAVTWRLAFAIAVLVAGAAALAIWRAGVPAPHAPAPTGSFPAQHKRARVEPTLIVVFAIVALEFTLSFWLASYLTDDVGLARGAALPLVSALYAANLAGRLIASRLARGHAPEGVLAGALTVILIGLPFLFAATGAAAALVGIALAGAGIGALFPLTSSLHVQASARTADGALGELLSVAALGQIAGPLIAGAVAQAAGLRAGLLALPALTVLAGAALAAHRARSNIA